MAFFKFRFPGQNVPAAVDAPASGQSENLEVVRRRARHRLMGAVVLVLVAVVGFPLLFDTQPRPVAVDTPIVIPDRQNVAPLSSSVPVPAAHAPAKPLLSASTAVPPAPAANAGLDAHEEVVASSPPMPVPMAKAEIAKEPVKTEPAKAPVAVEKTKDKTKEFLKPEPKPEPKAAAVKSKDDGIKAQALLEGKNTPAVSAGRVVIQVGAFTDPAKVRDVRQKLEQAGLKTYTQVVEGKDGKNTTRIRVGPYDSREEADKVAARIRKLDLSPAILKI